MTEEKKQQKNNTSEIFILIGFCIFSFVILASSFGNNIAFLDLNNKSSINVNVVNPTDELTKSLINIQYEHHEIHEGDHYFICSYLTNLNAGQNIDFVLNMTRVNTSAHMLWDFSSDLGATLNIYEGSSNILGGTLINISNNNRVLNFNSSIQVLRSPTSLTLGKHLGGFLVGGNRQGGTNTRSKEIILKPNTYYTFRFNNLVNNGNIGYCGEWYEH